VGLDTDVREWFEPRKQGRGKVVHVPRTKVPRTLIENSLG
jgi:hypothetical protein